MLYLMLAIISSALISLLMRWSEKYSKSNLAMLAMNYLMCCLMAGVFSGDQGLFPREAEGLGITLILGVIGGAVYLAAFLMMQWNIAKSGVLLSSTFMKLGILVPTILSVLIFMDAAGPLKWAGVFVAAAAIVIMNGGGKLEWRHAGGLLLLLLCGGCADFMSKLFDELAPADLKGPFLFYIFATALILCLIFCLLKGQKPGVGDVLFGLAIGIPNYFSSHFFLTALETVPPMAAFPSFSVGTVLLVAPAGILLFGEKLNRRKIISLVLILASLVLLNLKMNG